jgi:dTDP-4-dehydrorhamnose reductase
MIGSALVRFLGGGCLAPSRQDLDLSNHSYFEDPLREKGIHLVLFAAGGAGKEEAGLLEVNGTLPGALATACARAGSTFVYLSSSRVFDGSSPLPYGVGSAPCPVDAYGRSKALGERLTAEARGFVLRMPMVLGMRPGNPGGQVMTRLLALARGGNPVTFATDVVAQAVASHSVGWALDRLIRSGSPPGVYHLAPSGEASLWEIAARLFRALGLPEPGKALGADFSGGGPIHRNLALVPSEGLCPGTWEEAVDGFALDLEWHGS